MNGNQNNQQQGNWWESQGNGHAWWEAQSGPTQGTDQGECGPRINIPHHFYISEQQDLAKRKASTSLTLGIIGLALALFGTVLGGIVLGIIAIIKSNTSKKLYPTPFPEAKAGKVLGILAIIFGALPIAIVLIVLSFTLFLTLLAIIF